MLVNDSFSESILFIINDMPPNFIIKKYKKIAKPLYIKINCILSVLIIDLKPPIYMYNEDVAIDINNDKIKEKLYRLVIKDDKISIYGAGDDNRYIKMFAIIDVLLLNFKLKYFGIDLILFSWIFGPMKYENKNADI